MRKSRQCERWKWISFANHTKCRKYCIQWLSLAENAQQNTKRWKQRNEENRRDDKNDKRNDTDVVLNWNCFYHFFFFLFRSSVLRCYVCFQHFFCSLICFTLPRSHTLFLLNLFLQFTIWFSLRFCLLDSPYSRQSEINFFILFALLSNRRNAEFNAQENTQWNLSIEMEQRIFLVIS